MGEEQIGCGGGRIFRGRRCRRDHDVVPRVDRQPKADDRNVGRWRSDPENSREGRGQCGEEFVDESGGLARCGEVEQRGESRGCAVQSRQFEGHHGRRRRCVGQGDTATHRVGLVGGAARLHVNTKCVSGGGGRDTGFGDGHAVVPVREDAHSRRGGVSGVGDHPD